MITMRLDLNAIINWIEPNSSVLDLGCGDGALLATLQQKSNVSGYGLEIDSDDIQRCVQRGVNVIEQNVDEGLSNFSDNSFDTVVMTQALQAMRRPDQTLKEMLRIGKECIITFPNFGHWHNRLAITMKGLMPVSETIPYQWYDTPNIHFCTVNDFEILCKDMGIQIKKRKLLTPHFPDRLFKNSLPNLFGEIAVYHLSAL